MGGQYFSINKNYNWNGFFLFIRDKSQRIARKFIKETQDHQEELSEALKKTKIEYDKADRETKRVEKKTIEEK